MLLMGEYERTAGEKNAEEYLVLAIEA